MQTTEWKRVEPVWNRILDMVWVSVETAQKSLQQVSTNLESLQRVFNECGTLMDRTACFPVSSDGFSEDSEACACCSDAFTTCSDEFSKSFCRM